MSHVRNNARRITIETALDEDREHLLVSVF
jgi:hypothetical protein